jgi:hypothetical protein
MSPPPSEGPARSPTPRWFHLLIGFVGLLIGALYLFTAFTSGPLSRNLIFAGIWGGMGLLWLLVGFILPGKKGPMS